MRAISPISARTYPAILFSGIILLMFLFSCTRNVYHQVRVDSEIVFSRGSWLINHVQTDLPHAIKMELNEQILKKLKAKGSPYVVFIEELKPDSINPAPPRFRVSDSKLERLASDTWFNFLINTKVEMNPEKNRMEAGILIYDIKSREIFYSQLSSIKISERKIESSRYLRRKALKIMNLALREFDKHIKATEISNR